MNNTCHIWKLQATEERFQLTPLQPCQPFCHSGLKGWVLPSSLPTRKLLCPSTLEGVVLSVGWEKVPQRAGLCCEELQEAAPCLLSDGWDVCWALLMASLCSPSRVRLMTALIMPDGSHQSSFNSRKMPKYCLQNQFVRSFSSFQPGSDPQAALRDLLRRSCVENCQNRLLYGFSED